MRTSAILGAALWSAGAQAGGVTPYMPLNLNPAMESQIERVMTLAGRPVMRRPIPAVAVLDALPHACAIDRALCESASQYLQRYMRNAGITSAELQVSTATGDRVETLPNEHGLTTDDDWQVSGTAFYQPNDYLLLNAGGIANKDVGKPTGTYVSAGFDWAQLDVGYRDHWLSPMRDSSTLISTQAPTMPSITLSNAKPVSPLGIQYEVFLAEMSHQDDIQYLTTGTSGHPHLSGLQVSIEPVYGYSLSVNRLMQFGGGARGNSGLSGWTHALFSNSQAQTPDTTTAVNEFGNQAASLASNLIFPGKVPFAVRLEYAGEDNAFDGSYRLGKTAFTVGLNFPLLWRSFDLNYEITEWQNTWYTHHIYPDGLTNNGHVIGHWFGDERQFGDGVGGHSQLLRFGWTPQAGGYLQATYRNLANDSYSPVSYRHLNELGLRYTNVLFGRTMAGEFSIGRDVFGASYARLAASVDLAPAIAFSSAPDYLASTQDSFDTDLFVDVGANRSHVNVILGGDPFISNVTPNKIDYHFGLGARRPVGDHSDVGVRLELDRMNEHSLISLRAVDYRYRFGKHLAVNGFFGVGRYEVELPAYGYYVGAGLQWMDLLPKWDVSLDTRHYDKVARSKLLATDPNPPGSTDQMYFDVTGLSLYLSRRF